MTDKTLRSLLHKAFAHVGSTCSIIETNAAQEPARSLGHAIIGLAAVAGPEHLKAVLTKTRGQRWGRM